MIRVFPRRTKWTPNDDLVFIGDPPLFRPEADEVHISVTFTWDIPEARRLFREWKQFYLYVRCDGPALGNQGNEFVSGQYIKKGVTITSRGCPWKCPWCFVPQREGEIRELEVKEGWIIQDNNLLACSRSHLGKVFEMLKRQIHSIRFSGGLDGRLLSTWHIDEFKKINIEEFWFACDHNGAFKNLERTADLISDFHKNQKRCFVMIGYNGETILEAEKRLEKVYEMGFLPFSQLYQGFEFKNYPTDWKKLNRKWSRPAAYRKKKETVS